MEDDFNVWEFVSIEREEIQKDRVKLEYLKTALREIKDVLFGKTFPEFEYDDPKEEIKNIIKELEKEIGEI